MITDSRRVNSKFPSLLKQGISWELSSRRNIFYLVLFLSVGLLCGALIRPLNSLITNLLEDNPLVVQTDWADFDSVKNIFYGLTSMVLFVPFMLLAAIQGGLSGNKLVRIEMQSRFMIELVWPIRRIEMMFSLIISKFCMRALGPFLTFLGAWLSFNVVGSSVAMNLTLVISLAMSLTIPMIFLGTYVLSMAMSLLTKNDTMGAIVAIFAFLFLGATFLALRTVFDPAHSIPELAWMENMDLLGWFMQIIPSASGFEGGQPLNLVMLVVSISIAFPLIVSIILFRTLDIHTK